MVSNSVRAANHLANFQEKVGFFSGNYYLLAVWPITALVVSIIGWYFLHSNLNENRVKLEERSLGEVKATAKSFAEQVRRSVEVIDQITLHVRYDWDISNGRLRLDDARANGLFPPASLAFVAIIDSHDMLVTGTLPAPANRFLGNTEDFVAQKSTVEDFLYIGKPFIGPVSKRHTIPFNRKLFNPDGSFGGIVVVSVVPKYFTSSYDDEHLGQHGLLGIVGHDDVIRTIRVGQTESSPDVNMLLRPPRFPAQTGGSTVLEGSEWFMDNRTRYVGWGDVEGYPLIAMVGLDQQAVLTPYLTSRDATIRTAVAATLTLALFTLIAMALSLRLGWRKHQLETMRLNYRMATERGNEGFYIGHPIRDANGHIIDLIAIDCNHRGAELFGLRPDELLGKKISDVYQTEAFERRMEIFRRAMERGSYETELEEPQDGPMSAHWCLLKAIRADGDLAITLRDISDMKSHVADLERRGNEDTLTGLPNRHWVNAELPKAIEHAAARQVMLAVLFIDLDGFKAVNDTRGHAAGDDVLRNAARRLKEAIRPLDRVARLGGDEFVVVIENITQKDDAAQVAGRIVHAFHDAFRLSGSVHAISASVGISVFPADGTNADILLHHADIAMYSVKMSGKNNYHFFDQKFYEAVLARHDDEAELRHAIENDQFVMYYQPRVDMTTGAISSMEALVRWVHPTKGLINPVEFIPLAEETGLILRLGEMVIDKVCAQLAHWSQTGPGPALVPVSVNVSPRQFNESDIATVLSISLARHNIAPHLIEIELTESSMMGGNHEVTDTLAAIQKMGIKLLVDDFGTGYSSLSQLQRLDFDVLKVDRAFTAELGKTGEGNVFFKAIITMAHELGMRVVAEGVETPEQIKILKSLKCDEIQGSYISMPLPPSESQLVRPRWPMPLPTQPL